MSEDNKRSSTGDTSESPSKRRRGRYSIITKAQEESQALLKEMGFEDKEDLTPGRRRTRAATRGEVYAPPPKKERKSTPTSGGKRGKRKGKSDEAEESADAEEPNTPVKEATASENKTPTKPETGSPKDKDQEEGDTPGQEGKKTVEESPKEGDTSNEVSSAAEEDAEASAADTASPSKEASSGAITAAEEPEVAEDKADGDVPSSNATVAKEPTEQGHPNEKTEKMDCANAQEEASSKPVEVVDISEEKNNANNSDKVKGGTPQAECIDLEEEEEEQQESDIEEVPVGPLAVQSTAPVNQKGSDDVIPLEDITKNGDATHGEETSENNVDTAPAKLKDDQDRSSKIPMSVKTPVVLSPSKAPSADIKATTPVFGSCVESPSKASVVDSSPVLE